MAKLSRHAPSSAATPSTTATATSGTTATATSATSATATSATSATEDAATAATTATTTRKTANHASQQRLSRRSSAKSSKNNNNIPKASALIDPSVDGLHELPSASPTPAALSNNSNIQNSNITASTHAPAHPHSATPTPYMPLLPPGERNLTDAENAAERARIREEFFATYDVMTGVRIAATLGGFFGLMVFLIVWKSRSSSNETLKVLKDPKMAAVAAVCMQEEEEREIHEAIVATGMSIYPDEYDALVYRRQRMLSLGNVSAPPLINRGYRCGSVGGVGPTGPVGYSYLLEPPRRFSYSAMSPGGPAAGPGRRKSGSESSRILSNYPMGGSFGTDDYFVETDDELDGDEYMQCSGQDDQEQLHHQRTDSTRSKPGFLSVPMPGHDSRRSSAMTCCSTDSSYLERRTSAYTLGMSNLPPTLQRKLSTASRTSSIDNWDYYYPDIQVIQPTPKASPCPSERSIHEATGIGAATTTKSKSSTGLGAPNFKRKHSIVSYDPESAQAGRKQQIHSISADTVDVYPYNQNPSREIVDLGMPIPKPIQSAPPSSSAHQAFHFCDSPSEELRLGVRRKLTLVELQHNESNNNSFPYTANAAMPQSATATATSSSISVDSTPVSLDRLNGSLSMSISAKAPPNNGNGAPEKRAPLASLSSFKISSLECPDSELRSLDEDSVFGLESPADTDDDMQQLSSDSEEQAAIAAQANEIKTNPVNLPVALPLKRMSMSAVPTLGGGVGAGARPRRPLLQRHRTISASSSDRVALIGAAAGQLPLMQFQRQGGCSPAAAASAAAPLETHFGAVIQSSPPRRGQLLQQYSDPQSMATTTTTTTTTTTEEDTCSTLNTEVGLGLDFIGGIGGVGGGGAGGGGGGGESTTHTQYSSLNTVISLGHSTTPSPSATHSPRMDNNQAQPLTTATTQLPVNHHYHHDHHHHHHDRCPSSTSDSAVLASRTQTICMPSTLKDLILRGGNNGANTVSKSATNLSLPSNEPTMSSPTSAVILELPLIRLPNDDNKVEDHDNVDEEQVGHVNDDKATKSDPSLPPGTSRKWSKETLF